VISPLLQRLFSYTRPYRGRMVLAFLAMIVYGIYSQVTEALSWYAAPSEVDGIWKVTAFSADGVDHPLATDELRWRKLLIAGSKGGFGIAVKHQTTDVAERMFGEHDDAAHTLTIKLGENTSEVWHYELRGDTLTVDATHGAHKLHVVMSREPDPLLVTRGFHWVQEFPFNR